MALWAPAWCPAQDYVLGEGDLLKITVYESDDLTTVTRVSGDGAISFPLVGQVKVAGLTVLGAEQKLTGLLSNGYVNNPQVSIFVTEFKSRKVTILGEVKNPGLYELNANASLIEMISRAGGFTEKAGDTLVVQRKAAGGADGPQGTAITVDLKELMEKGNVSSNLPLLDGDSIFITKSGFVYVTGEVQKPGAYKVEKDTTIIKAITLAGGLTEKAAPGRTKLIRTVGGKEQTIKAGMGDTVQADDVITVPESFF